MEILGLDVGGSAVRAAVIDTERGQLVSSLRSLPTPQPATPAAVLKVITSLISQLDWSGPIGCGFPAVIRAGQAATAANIDDTWIGVNVLAEISRSSGCLCRVLNDADAAGLAEMHYGSGQGESGSVLVLTLGTGIGSALFYKGQLFPNLELGFLPLNGQPAERFAAASVRTAENLDWATWAARLDHFLNSVERLLGPDLIIVGGAVSRHSDEFFPFLQTRARLLPAQLENRAGLVGAARWAAQEISANEQA